MLRGNRGGGLLLLLCVVVARAGLADDATEVRACYDAYKTAILAKDGPAAVALVDSRTLAYYGRVREMALKLPAADTRKLPLLDKLMVLTLRHRVPVEKVAAWDATSTVEHAVNEGWIGAEDVKTNELGDIAVDGQRATGVHITKGVATSLRFSFYQEDGKWQINLTEAMPAAEKHFKLYAASNRQTEDEFLATVLELVSGKAVDDKVWEPLQP